MGRPKNDQSQNAAGSPAANPPNEGLLNAAPAPEGGEQSAQPQTGNPGNDSAQGAEQSGAAPEITPDVENPQQGNGAGASENAAPEGGEREGGTDNAGASSPPKEGKKRVQHPGKKSKKVIVGAALVEFDAEGIAELDTTQAQYLLGIPGYKEIKENA